MKNSKQIETNNFFDRLEQAKKDFEEDTKTSNFLEYFEQYHNLVAFKGLGRETYENNVKQNNMFLYGVSTRSQIQRFGGEYGYSMVINIEHLESFKEHCTFLNDIPKAHHKKEAEQLLSIFCQYSSFYQEFDYTYAKTFNEDDEQITRNMSNKLKSDIQIAKKFKDSLYGHIEDDGYYKSNFEYAESYKISKETKTLSQMDTFFILKGSLEMYINDLEQKAYKIRPKEDYENFFKKPPKTCLMTHLKELVKKYNINNTTSSIKHFGKYLNTSSY